MVALVLQTAWQLLMAELTAINGQGVTCCSKCYSYYGSKTEIRIYKLRPLQNPSLSLLSDTGLLCETIYYFGFRLPWFLHLYFLLWTQDWMLLLTQSWGCSPLMLLHQTKPKKITFTSRFTFLVIIWGKGTLRWRQKEREEVLQGAWTDSHACPVEDYAGEQVYILPPVEGPRWMFPGESCSPCRHRFILKNCSPWEVTTLEQRESVRRKKERHRGALMHQPQSPIPHPPALLQREVG